MNATGIRQKLLRKFNSNSVNSNILRAALTIGILTLGVKVISLGKEMLVASSFGVSDVVDSFLIAFLLPSFFVSVITSALNAALLPTFVRTAEEEGSQAAQELFSSVMLFSSTFLCILSIGLYAAAPLILPFLAPGFSEEKLFLTKQLFTVMLPMLLLSGISTTWASIMNAKEKFALPSISDGLIPVCQIFCVVCFAHSWGIFALAAGTIAGFFARACVLGCALSRRGFRLVPAWFGLSPNLRIVIGQYAPMLAAGVFISGNTIIDQSMAAWLAPGSVSSLGYGIKFIALFQGIGSAALATAVLPYFSKMVAAHDWKQARHSLKTYTCLIFAVTVPLTLAIVVFSGPIVALLFQRGAFTAEDAESVGNLQSMYALQLPFFAAGILCVRMISALRANIVLMVGTMISFAVNIIGNILLVRVIGLAGIALSTSVVYLLSFVYLRLMLGKLVSEAEKKDSQQEIPDS